jgi:hypothetical protein
MAHPGATFAFEVTSIERWLEIEVGISVIAADGGTELPVDVISATASLIVVAWVQAGRHGLAIDTCRRRECATRGLVRRA